MPSVERFRDALVVEVAIAISFDDSDIVALPRRLFLDLTSFTFLRSLGYLVEFSILLAFPIEGFAWRVAIQVIAAA